MTGEGQRGRCQAGQGAGKCGRFPGGIPGAGGIRAGEGGELPGASAGALKDQVV